MNIIDTIAVEKNTCFNKMSNMRTQQDKFLSESVSKSICLLAGNSSSDKPEVLPESSSTTGAATINNLCSVHNYDND